MRARTVTTALALAAGLGWAAGCSTNPATGNRQLNIYSEEQEIQLGRQTDQQVVQQLGLYDDPELQAYVHRVGTALARQSERPNLPWTFRVIDDSSVNAFALPGGFIYVTRGIMAHMSSEAELAGVLGHEIGHVTARHSVNQMSKAQLASIGLGLGMILSPEVAQYGDLAQTGMQLAFLKFGRDDERQADDLGLQYLNQSGYPTEAMGEMFGLLTRVSQQETAGRLPNWLSTHPNPQSRLARIESRSTEIPESAVQASWNRDVYLRQLEGVVYGPDPREGFFRAGVYYHPELRFQIQGPPGWQGVNQKQAVVWQSPRQDALFGLTLVPAQSADAAAQQFFRQQGVQATERWNVRPSLGQSLTAGFAVTAQQNPLRGGVSFVQQGQRVYQLIGYSRPNDWRRNQNDVARAIASFAPLTDRRALDAQPMRVDVITLDRAMTLEEVARRHGSSVDLQELALLNNVEPGTRFEAGQRVKTVRGENLSG